MIDELAIASLLCLVSIPFGEGADSKVSSKGTIFGTLVRALILLVIFAIIAFVVYSAYIYFMYGAEAFNLNLGNTTVPSSDNSTQVAAQTTTSKTATAPPATAQPVVASATSTMSWVYIGVGSVVALALIGAGGFFGYKRYGGGAGGADGKKDLEAIKTKVTAAFNMFHEAYSKAPEVPGTRESEMVFVLSNDTELELKVNATEKIKDLHKLVAESQKKKILLLPLTDGKVNKEIKFAEDEVPSTTKFRVEDFEADTAKLTSVEDWKAREVLLDSYLVASGIKIQKMETTETTTAAIDTVGGGTNNMEEDPSNMLYVGGAIAFLVVIVGVVTMTRK